MTLDTNAIVWYAAICGTLSALAPSLGGRVARIAIGAVVSIIAATVLSLPKSMMGY